MKYKRRKLTYNKSVKQRDSYTDYFFLKKERELKESKEERKWEGGRCQGMTAWEVKLGKRIPVMGELKACLK